MARTSRADPDQLLVRDGWKHYRRTYSLAEVRWGFATLCVLSAVIAWIVWRGQHPDPSLYSETPIAESAAASIEASADRGPVPNALALDGWTEGPVTQFSAENLYVKINGRADFFLSKGFEQLYFISLSSGDDTVDIEMYDMGLPANAVGAFTAERRDTAAVDAAEGMMSYASRNAMFLQRSQYYVRAIGSAESEPIQDQLEHLNKAFESGLTGSQQPWAYDLFVGGLGLDASAVSYKTQNAFSFEFGRDVYIAELGDDVVGFIIAKDSAGDATESAQQYMEGFASIGARDGKFVKDEFVDTFSIAAVEQRFVVGIKGAPDKETAAAALVRMREAIARLGPDTLERARPAEAPSDDAEEDDGDGDEEQGSDE